MRIIPREQVYQAIFDAIIHIHITMTSRSPFGSKLGNMNRMNVASPGYHMSE